MALLTTGLRLQAASESAQQAAAGAQQAAESSGYSLSEKFSDFGSIKAAAQRAAQGRSGSPLEVRVSWQAAYSTLQAVSKDYYTGCMHVLHATCVVVFGNCTSSVPSADLPLGAWKQLHCAPHTPKAPLFAVLFAAVPLSRWNEAVQGPKRPPLLSTTAACGVQGLKEAAKQGSQAASNSFRPLQDALDFEDAPGVDASDPLRMAFKSMDSIGETGDSIKRSFAGSLSGVSPAADLL